MNKAIFIDKDGTLIPDLPYNVNPQLITLENNSSEGLNRLQAAGFLIVIISNQSGVARGYFHQESLAAVEIKVKSLLANEGIELNGFYYCPHHPEGTVTPYNIECTCRKPFPGLILEAARELNIDLKLSWMIGDILNDIEAGSRAGCKTILIDNGNETEWQIDGNRIPSFVVKSINQAAESILLGIANNISHV